MHKCFPFFYLGSSLLITFITYTTFARPGGSIIPPDIVCENKIRISTILPFNADALREMQKNADWASAGARTKCAVIVRQRRAERQQEVAAQCERFKTSFANMCDAPIVQLRIKLDTLSDIIQGLYEEQARTQQEIHELQEKVRLIANKGRIYIFEKYGSQITALTERTDHTSEALTNHESQQQDLSASLDRLKGQCQKVENDYEDTCITIAEAPVEADSSVRSERNGVSAEMAKDVEGDEARFFVEEAYKTKNNIIRRRKDLDQEVQTSTDAVTLHVAETKTTVTTSHDTLQTILKSIMPIPCAQSNSCPPPIPPNPTPDPPQPNPTPIVSNGGDSNGDSSNATANNNLRGPMSGPGFGGAPTAAQTTDFGSANAGGYSNKTGYSTSSTSGFSHKAAQSSTSSGFSSTGFSKTKTTEGQRFNNGVSGTSSRDHASVSRGTGGHSTPLILGDGHANSHSGFVTQATTPESKKSGSHKQIYSSKTEKPSRAAAILGRNTSPQHTKASAQERLEQLKNERTLASADSFDPDKYAPKTEAERRALARAAGKTSDFHPKNWPADIRRHDGSTHDVFFYLNQQFKHQFSNH